MGWMPNAHGRFGSQKDPVHENLLSWSSWLLDGTCQVQTHPPSSVGARLGTQTHILGYTTPLKNFKQLQCLFGILNYYRCYYCMFMIWRA